MSKKRIRQRVLHFFTGINVFFTILEKKICMVQAAKDKFAELIAADPRQRVGYSLVTIRFRSTQCYLRCVSEEYALALITP
jgi:hypothetical protein